MKQSLFIQNKPVVAKSVVAQVQGMPLVVAVITGEVVDILGMTILRERYGRRTDSLHSLKGGVIPSPSAGHFPLKDRGTVLIL